MQTLNKEKILKAVRKDYGNIAKSEISNCGCDCSPNNSPTAEEISVKMGYSTQDVTNVPQGANMGLGCGNPQAIASLKAGETVVDLGSGGGFDCFLAARAVGESGNVIGVDMTPEMVSKARLNGEKGGYKNVEFRLGEIENLPIADNSANVIISNCVINLSPDKPQVFEEAYRILKKGGRLAISDIVATADIPEDIMNNLANYTGCVSGAIKMDEIETILKGIGFKNVNITPKDSSKAIIKEWSNDSNVSDFVVSASIEAMK